MSSTSHQGYRFLEHMTDAEIEAFGSNLDEAFENAGRALEDTMVNLELVKPIVRKEIRIEAKDKKEDLLYDWLESLIIIQDTEGLIFSEFKCKISSSTSPENGANTYALAAEVRGEKFNPSAHEQKTSVKAPTFHGMEIAENKENHQVTLKFLLDL